MFDLVRAALRQRPNYIIVGEVRGKETYTMFQAMATGHTTYSTMHADSVKSMVNRSGEPADQHPPDPPLGAQQRRHRDPGADREGGRPAG